jgi:superfamily II RNA helicase
VKTITIDGGTTVLTWRKPTPREARSMVRRSLPKWQGIADEVGLTAAACHMIFYNYRGRRTHRANDPKVVKMLQIIQERGLPPRRTFSISRAESEEAVNQLLAKHLLRQSQKKEANANHKLTKALRLGGSR